MTFSEEINHEINPVFMADSSMSFQPKHKYGSTSNNAER